MGHAQFNGMTEDLHAHLVDGHLPATETMRLLVETPSIGQYAHMPYSWEGHSLDSIYETLATNIRETFCHSRSSQKLPRHCHAWLLKPADEWEAQYQLKDQRHHEPRRRLLIALYHGCEHGEKCLENLLKTSQFEAIRPQDYIDPGAFERSAKKLLEEVCLPVEAPGIAATKRITQSGYDCRGFG